MSLVDTESRLMSDNQYPMSTECEVGSSSVRWGEGNVAINAWQKVEVMLRACTDGSVEDANLIGFGVFAAYG